MTKEVLYLYVGTNGSILTPIHLEDVYYSRRIRLTAEKDKRLTKNHTQFFDSIVVPEEDVELWEEV